MAYGIRVAWDTKPNEINSAILLAYYRICGIITWSKVKNIQEDHQVLWPYIRHI